MKKKLVFLTGAGISAESDIPTFRDAVTGLWENASIEEVCTAGCLERNEERAHRDDLMSEYTSELEVVKKLLPEPVNESQIKTTLGIWADKSGYARHDFGENSYALPIIEIPKKEMGTAIKYLKSKFPTADDKMVSEIVKKYIV